MLASLNHPNIAALYGFEDSGERPALVMELVDAPTLADRIARGPIPPDEALMRVLVSGGAGEPIPIQSSLPVAPSRISPNAVGKDGRIVLSIAPPDSWFLDVGILDPRSGKLERVPINLTGGGYAIYRRAADGTGADEKVLETPGSEIEPYSVSPDGRYIAYQFFMGSKANANDVWALPMYGDRKPFPVFNTPFNEVDPAISPDGKWVAYLSNDTGQYEVYIKPYLGSLNARGTSTGSRALTCISTSVGSQTSLLTYSCSKTKFDPFCTLASTPPGIFASPAK